MSQVRGNSGRILAAINENMTDISITWIRPSIDTPPAPRKVMTINNLGAGAEKIDSPSPGKRGFHKEKNQLTDKCNLLVATQI